MSIDAHRTEWLAEMKRAKKNSKNADWKPI